jgi:uncharacterized protein (DUF305 family)
MKTIPLLLTLLLAPAALATPMTGGMSSEMSGGMSDEMSGMMSVASELEFLAGMVPHHQGALDDARLALERSERPEVQRLAQEIIAAQEAEIAQMNGWLDAWYPEGDREAAGMSQAMTSMDMPDLGSLSGGAFDRAFLEGMIMHHRMAVQMADALLERDLVEHEEVGTLAEEIRRSQEAEIREMQGWLEAWYGAAPESEPAAGGHDGH